MNRRPSHLVWSFLTLMIVPIAAHAAVFPGSVAEQKADFNGTWDLTWHTDKGAIRKGDMEVVQSGSDLNLVIHGSSNIKARGKADGNNLSVRGSRLFISYVITGKVTGNSMTGSLKIMSAEKLFTAERRIR